jgi:hypothetical protein
VKDEGKKDLTSL